MIQLMVVALVGCGGGGGLVGAAETAAATACACADKACAKDAVKAYNKVAYKAEDERKALDAANKAKLDAAVDKMSACRDKLP